MDTLLDYYIKSLHGEQFIMWNKCIKNAGLPNKAHEYVCERIGYSREACELCWKQPMLYAYDNSEIYICDPNKNVDCSKTSCYINGGYCSHTSKKEFELVKGE